MVLMGSSILSLHTQQVMIDSVYFGFLGFLGVSWGFGVWGFLLLTFFQKKELGEERRRFQKKKKKKKNLETWKPHLLFLS